MLTLFLNGQQVRLTPAPSFEKGEVFVPISAFSSLIGAEATTDDGGRQVTICKGDICIPLEVREGGTSTREGTTYAPLSAIGDPLGLSWEVEGEALRLTTDEAGAPSGLGIGDSPPGFTLPDLHTGVPVSLGDYLGRKVVFYMWASW